MKLMDMKQDRAEALKAADAILAKADASKRELSTEERALFDAHVAEAARLSACIKPIEESQNNSLARLFRENPGAIFDAGNPNRTETPHGVTTPGEHPKATEFRGRFAAWMNNTLSVLGGGTPQMEATAPSGPISVGTTSGWDSVGITVPTEILPYLPSS